MELHDAIAQIHLIRTQMARTERLRGLGALPVAFSGLLALAAGCAQALWIEAPGDRPEHYLALWVGVALLGAGIAGAGLWARCRLSGSQLIRATALLAVEQFAPAMAAGALITLLLPLQAPESVWLLPGLWQILYGVGLLAAWRLLPRGVLLVGLFYLCAGGACLALHHAALDPWAMALPFACGQLAMAAVLYWSTERRTAGTEVDHGAA